MSTTHKELDNQVTFFKECELHAKYINRKWISLPVAVVMVTMRVRTYGFDEVEEQIKYELNVLKMQDQQV